MINLFDQQRSILLIILTFVASILLALIVLTILFWRIPWLASAWWRAPAPQQIGMLRWNQQGLSAMFPITSQDGPVTNLSDITFDGRWLWVTGVDGTEGYVFRVDPSNGETTGRNVELGNESEPEGVIFDGKHIWVADRGSKSLFCFDPIKDTKATPWELMNSNHIRSGSPYYLAFDGEYIWVTDHDGGAVWRLLAGSCEKPTTGEYADTRITKVFDRDHQNDEDEGVWFNKPLGIIFDGTYIWVANWGSNEVMRLSPDDCDVDKCEEALIIEVGEDNSQPSNLAYDGTYLWVTLKGTGQVARIHAQTGLVFGKPDLGHPIIVSALRGVGDKPDEPCKEVTSELDGIAFDGIYIWIASNTGWVCQLRASDATALSEFRAIGTEKFNPDEDNSASRIAFDGTFIWIIMTNGNTSSFTRR